MATPSPVTPQTQQPSQGDSFDQAKFDQILQQHGYTPPQPTGSVGGANNWRSLVQPRTETSTLPPSLGDKIGQEQVAGGQKILSSVDEGAQKFSQIQSDPNTVKGLAERVGTLLQTGLGAAAGGAQVITSPLTALLSKIAPDPSKPDVGVDTQAIQDWAKQHPELTKTLGDLMQVLSVGGLETPVPEAGVGETFGGAAKSVASDVGEGVSKITAPAPATPIESPAPALPSEDFVRQLVTPEQTKKTMAQNIKLGKVEEGGVFADRTITPDKSQLNIENEVKSVPGISSKNTLLQNANAIHDEIGNVAQSLRDSLSKREIQPIVTQEDMKGLVDSTMKKIGEDPTLTGNASETAQKILNKFSSFLPSGKDITASDILTARQKLDSWISNLKGDKVFDPATDNAVTTALRSVRQSANDLLMSKATDVPVQDMLRRQSRLYDALENIAPKAAKEPGSMVGRVTKTIKEHPVISTAVGLTGADVLMHKLGI